MAYRASIGGAFGGGAGPATAHPIDVGQILDAFTNGASTLIQNAYARKRGEQELALQKQRTDAEAQRYADAQRIAGERYAAEQEERKANRERQSIQDAFAREKFDADMALRRQQSDREFIAKGGTVGGTSMGLTQPTAQPLPSIAERYAGSLSVGGAPSPANNLVESLPTITKTTTPDAFTPLPKAPIMGTPEWERAQEFVAGLGRRSHEENRRYDAAHPMPQQETTKPTEFSNKAALVYPRAQQAFALLEPVYQTGIPAHSMLNKVPGLGNYGVTDRERQAIQAAETISSAILRLESGAAISEHEVKEYAKQFLPQPGDDAQTRANKRATLVTQLERMRAAASPTMSREAPANPYRR